MCDWQRALHAYWCLLLISSINEAIFQHIYLQRATPPRLCYPQQIAARQHLESVPEIWWPTFSEEPLPSYHLSAVKLDKEMGRLARPEISEWAASNTVWKSMTLTCWFLGQLPRFSSFELGKKTLKRNSAARFFIFHSQSSERLPGHAHDELSDCNHTDWRHLTRNSSLLNFGKASSCEKQGFFTLLQLNPCCPFFLH